MMLPPEDEIQIKQAVELLHDGQVIVYPTEAVYGLGCDPENLDAVSAILALKQRPIEKGLILVAANWEQVEQLVEPILPPLLARVHASWPGPTTWVFPAKEAVLPWIRGEHLSLAIRVSAHPVVKRLCQLFGGPIVSTSANLHGQPPVRDGMVAKTLFASKVAMIVPGKVGKLARPTSIRDAVTGQIIRL